MTNKKFSFSISAYTYNYSSLVGSSHYSSQLDNKKKIVTCHNIYGPGINGPAGPLMSSYLVRSDHLCIDINGPGKT